MSKLILIGIGPDGPTQAGQTALQKVSCVVTAARHKDLISNLPCEILPISPLSEALSKIETRLTLGDVAVLASGDPLFFGIGRSLSTRFGAERLTIHPAISSMQLAFSQLKEPWDDAIFMSLHGRVKPSLAAADQMITSASPREQYADQDLFPALMTQRPLFLFTDPHQRPEIIAAGINRHMETIGLNDSDCRIMVAEELGSDNERITHGTPKSIATQRFSDLNVMIIRLTAPASPTTKFLFGLKETEIAHSRGLITKDEVRSAILHRLRLPQTGVFWDIGAGSGSISIEAARLCPGLTVFAIERNTDQQQNIAINRQKFRLANLHLIPGQAPDPLTELPDPDRVFIGGSGGQLPAIVTIASTRLKAHGIIIASAVTKNTRDTAPRIFHQHGLHVDISTITISREIYPPQANGPLSLNPITIITGSK